MKLRDYQVAKLTAIHNGFPNERRFWILDGKRWNEVDFWQNGWDLEQVQQYAKLERIVCGCGKGHASPFDNMCRFCREKHLAPTAALRNKYGVRPKGYGLTLNAAYGPINY